MSIRSLTGGLLAFSEQIADFVWVRGLWRPSRAGAAKSTHRTAWPKEMAGRV